MKKILIYLILSIYFISCNHDNIPKQPIETNIIGLELCKKIDYYAINNIFNETLGKEFYIGEDFIDDDIVNFNCLPYSEPEDKLSFYHENLSWKFINIMTFKQQIYYVCIYDSYDTSSEALKQYKKALRIFNRKYGKANYIVNDETKKLTSWSDGITSVSVSYYNIIFDNIRIYFCEITYTNNEIDDKVKKI